MGKAACEALVKAESGSEEMQALRECFSALMNRSEESIASALEQFEKRIPSLSPFSALIFILLNDYDASTFPTD